MIEIPDARNGYLNLVFEVLKEGKKVAPRGIATREIEDAVISIADPYNTLPLGVGRNVNTGVGAVEACQLLAGMSLPQLVLKIGPQFKSFTEDNGLFHGAYGLRTNGQYQVVLERLRDDPNTRQAVVTIWDPKLDLLPSKRDYPCTILHQFRIRDGRLNMSVYMRSNDVWLGAAYDFLQFSRVQIALASLLDVEVGAYNHHVGSLHIYESDVEAVGQLHDVNLKDTPEIPPAITGLPDDDWGEIVHKAQLALFAAENDDDWRIAQSDQQVLWYADAMRRAIARASR